MVTGCVIQKCPNCENGPPYPNAHRIYRGKWYDTYECGRYLMDHNCYQKAITLFAQSLMENPTDTRYARSYSTHFVKDYFPNREQGIAWYFLGDYEKAHHALSISISQFPSEKAHFFLDRVNQKKFKTLGIAPTKPHIVIDQLNANNVLLSASYPVNISGRVTDPQYISHISIANIHVFQDYSKKDITFSHHLYLAEGEHPVDILAKNLNEGQSLCKIVVHVDRTGPEIVFMSNDPSNLSGYVYDTNGLKHIQLNDRIIQCHSQERMPFQMNLTQTSIDMIKAEDMAGNVTIRKHPIFRQTYHQTHQLFAESSQKKLYSDIPKNGFEKIYIFVQDWKPFDYCYLPEMCIQGEIYSLHPLKELSINNRPISDHLDRHLIFSKKIHLDPGVNHVKIIAIDVNGYQNEQTITLTRYIPEAEKIKNRFRISIYPFEFTPENLHNSKYLNALLTVMSRQNRFKIIPRIKKTLQKTFWRFVSLKVQDELVDASIYGRIIKSPKDIEIYLPLISLNSQILGYADVYIPLKCQNDLNNAMKRLIKKLKYKFPKSYGAAVRQDNYYCTKSEQWQPFMHNIPLGWPAIFYREITHDPVRGSEQEVLGVSQIVRSEKNRFCVLQQNFNRKAPRLMVILK